MVACLCQQDVLGVGLLQQGAPELIPLGGLGEHQLVVEGGDAVVNDNIHPVAIAPELQVRVGQRGGIKFPRRDGNALWAMLSFNGVPIITAGSDVHHNLMFIITLTLTLEKNQNNRKKKF